MIEIDNETPYKKGFNKFMSTIDENYELLKQINGYKISILYNLEYDKIGIDISRSFSIQGFDLNKFIKRSHEYSIFNFGKIRWG